MTRFDLIMAVAKMLRPLLRFQPADLPSSTPPWEQIVALASGHLVTPALAWALRGHPDVAREPADYLEMMLDLTRQRNDMAELALVEILTALNAAQIEPLLLKGAAGMADTLYPHAGARIFADLDLLVPAERLQESSMILKRIGFEPTRDPNWVAIPHHHLPVQIHPDWPVGVELHRDILPAGYGGIATASAFLRQARKAEWRGCRLLLPAPTDWISHIVAHGQIVDGGHARGIPQLRQLLDLAMVRTRYEEKIDWDDIAGRFKRRRAGAALAETLGLDFLLLGQPPPPGFPADPDKVAHRLRRALDRPRTRLPAVLTQMLGSYARQLQARPLAIVNIFQPEAIQARYRRIAGQIAKRAS